jgi:flavin reductase (DIM6/NTAB) family NADH-FMN oxidoreductase RutF
MYYEPGTSHHGLPFDPFKSCVVPRPIGWLSTLSADGVANLAPFSQFNNATFDPPYVMAACNSHFDGREKDTVVNIERTGEFVWNMATYELRDAVVASSREFAPDVDEFEITGLSKAPSRLVKPPRVAESPVNFECKLHTTVFIPGDSPMGNFTLIIGRVVAVHIADGCIRADGRLDIERIRPLARMGYHDYTSISEVFTIAPQTSAIAQAGQEGNTEKIHAAMARAGVAKN